ncbi:hypothetical protein FHG87_018362, partial [Trinorchestia longiramus]
RAARKIRSAVKLFSRFGTTIQHPHYWPPLRPITEDSVVCYSTFTSANRLYWLPWLLESWKGPVSVSAYVSRNDYYVLDTVINYLKVCYGNAMERVTIHLVYPANSRPMFGFHINDTINVKDLDCNDPRSAIEEIFEILGSNSSATLSNFPQNQLRNLARQSCDTPFAISADVDMIPSPNMYENLSKFLLLRTDCKKCAYVIPIYEVETKENFLPSTKKSLLHLVKLKQARRYHIAVYSRNQGNSHLERWEAGNEFNEKDEVFLWTLNGSGKSSAQYVSSAESEPFKEMYKITTYVEYWEPIVVLKKTAPEFDERFVGYGHCRSSLHYELNKRGYHYWVLDRAFISHFGFQNLSSHPAFRTLEVK